MTKAFLPITTDKEFIEHFSKAQHTPGPWRIDCDGTLCAPADKDKGRLYDEILAAFPWSSFKEFNEYKNKANARLIAAAPDLLEALKSVLAGIAEAKKIGCISHTDCWDDAGILFHSPIEKAELIIAKEEGK